jgi:two-component system, NarL family, sensor kinase
MHNTDETRFSIILVSLLIFALIVIIIITSILFFNRKQRFSLEKQHLQSQFTQTLLQTQLEIQEQTLKNISQEIHDNTSQLLGLIKLNLATANPSQEAQTRDKINASLELVSQVITGIRQMSHTLDTDFVARMGLREAIRYQLELVQKTGQYQTSLAVSGEEQKTDAQKELILFRMVQEALNNIIKHAKASEIKVILDYLPETLNITIADNGTGFEQSDEKSAGIGLQNMHNRAKMIGATLHILSEIGIGTTTTIELPYAAPKNHD